jgi:hypothetical protein
MNIDPNVDACMSRVATFAPTNLCDRNSPRWRTGLGVRRSHAMNAIVTTTPASIEPITSSAPQPIAAARTIPQVRPNTAIAASATPTTSSFGRGPKLSRSRDSDSGTTASPIGTLSQKIQCQSAALMTAPPTTGPPATASPPIPAQTPIAPPRFSSGNASLIRVSVSGNTSAAPAPCATRAATSAPTLGDSAAAAEAAVKIATPTAYMRRRPNRSPNALPVISRHANERT